MGESADCESEILGFCTGAELKLSAFVESLVLTVLAVQLLRRVDAGEALELNGMADVALQQRLLELFKQLHLRCTRKVRCVFLRARHLVRVAIYASL